MNFSRSLLTLGLVSFVIQSPASPLQGAGLNETRQNPLLQKSELPFGAPDFSKIQDTDYLPAIEEAPTPPRRRSRTPSWPWRRAGCCSTV